MVYCIIAFSGELPVYVFNLLSATNCVKLISVDHSVINADFYVNIGQVGRVLKFLKQKNINQIFLLGGLKRPELKKIRLDYKGLIWALKLKTAFKQGDNALLEKIIELFQQENIKVCSVIDFENLKKELFLYNSKTEHLPSKSQIGDIAIGVEFLKTISHFDVGQSLVIQSGLILGVESLEGTDALIARCNDLKRNGPGPILVKMPKSNQTMKVDVPTVGINTIEFLEKFGFSGLAIDFRGCIILNKDLVIKKLNERKMFLYDIFSENRE